MAQASVQLPLDSTGKYIETWEISGLHRQVVVIGGTNALERAAVTNSTPTGTEYGLLSRIVSLPALSAGANDVGSVHVTDGTDDLEITAAGAITVDSITNALPTGSNTIGGVNIITDQPLQQSVDSVAVGDGTDTIAVSGSGEISAIVTSLPALPAGANDVGSVHVTDGTDDLEITAAGAIIVDSITSALPTGDNVVGRVKITDGTEVADVNASNQLEVHASVDHTTDSVAIGDGTDTLQISAAGAAHVTMLTALPTGANDIGSVHITDGTDDLEITAAGAITVDSISNALPAGGNTIGNVGVISLPALPSGTNDVGSVHITDGTDDLEITAAGAITVDSISNALPTGSNTIGGVNIITDQPLQQSVDSIAIGDGTDIVAVSGTGELSIAGTVSVTSLPATPAGTNDIGSVHITDGTDDLEITAAGAITVDSITNALPTGSNTIGNIGTVTTSITPGTSAAHLGKAIDSPAGGSDTGVTSLVVRDDVLGALTPVDGDYVPLRVDKSGSLWVIPGMPAAATLTTYFVTLSATGPTTLITPGSGKKICVTHVVISVGGTATNVKIHFGTQGSGTTIAAGQFAANGGLNDCYAPPFVPKGAADATLQATLSAANSVDVVIHYYEE